MELLLAISCLNFGILNTTDGKFMNELCEISNRKSDAKSANSSGNLDIWLCDKLRSENITINYTSNIFFQGTN